MRTFPAILLCLFAALAFARPAHAAVNLQTCAVTPTLGGLMGCPNGSFAFTAVSPTTFVRSQVNGIQGWRAFSTLKPGDQVYAADGSWHVLGSITVTQAPTSTPTPPVTADKWVAMNWTCSVANNVATCTAPITP